MRNLELLIPFYNQISSMSCWWASMRMILNYYGIYAGGHPSSFSSRFASSGQPRPYFYVDPEQLGHISEDGQIVHGRYAAVRSPSLWFEYGVPVQIEGLEMLHEIT